MIQTPLPTVGQRIPASLHPLATLAMRETGAQGYALFARDIYLGGCGAGDAGQSRSESLPLYSGDSRTGQLVFVYADPAAAASAKSRLSRIAAAIEPVWELYRAADRMDERRAELADSRIASRIVELLQSQNGGIDTVVDYVDSVLSYQRPA